MPRDRGYSLIELMIAVGIIALVAATGAGLTLASRSLAVAAAASELDQLLDSARTIARGVGGGTLVFAPDGDGTTVSLAARADDGTLVPTTLPALHTHAHIAEQEILGDPAFRLVLHGDGRLGGIPNAASAEVGCPASGAYHLHITAGGGSADRFLPCRMALAASGPIAYTGWPSATAAPLPVASCAGTCTPPQLPTPPSSTVTCPSGTSPVGTGCIPIGASTPTPAPPPPVPVPTATPTPGSTPTPVPTVAPTPTPSIVACDLVQSGTCYHRIQGPTLEQFQKEVTPAYTCDDSGMTCQWVNQVGQVIISTSGPYSFQPPIPPTDVAHELLFVVDGVAAMSYLCSPYHNIRDLAAAPPVNILWNFVGSGSASGTIGQLGLTPGYGQPAVFAYRHTIFSSIAPVSGAVQQTAIDTTQYSNTIHEFEDAAQKPLFSSVVSSTYVNASARRGDYITYVPDFTGCASGLPEYQQIDNQLYGISTAWITLEVYQAIQQ